MANCGMCDSYMYCPVHRPAPGHMPWRADGPFTSYGFIDTHGAAIEAKLNAILELLERLLAKIQGEEGT